MDVALYKINIIIISEADHSPLLKTYIALVVKLIYEFRYKRPTTQWKIIT